MTYAEMWDIAYSIGFHRGRMRAERNMAAIEADKDAFGKLLTSIPVAWHNTAHMRHDAGITEGDNS